MTRAREAETKFIREQNELEITKAKEMAGIETEKFKNMVDSIGSDTIASIANAGPEMQVGGLMVMFEEFVIEYSKPTIVVHKNPLVLVSLSCYRSRCCRPLV